MSSETLLSFLALKFVNRMYIFNVCFSVSFPRGKIAVQDGENNMDFT
jgi:hypothetical protein